MQTIPQTITTPGGGAPTTTTKRRREKTTHPTVRQIHQYQFNDDIDLAAVSGDEDEENDQDRNRNKRRRKKKEENELNQLEVGEKDHLFFQLDPRTKPTDEANELTQTAQLQSSLICYGHPCIIHPPPTTLLSPTASDDSHHLLPLVMRNQTNLSELELSTPHPSTTGADMTIYVDRYDLRLILDQSEWLPSTASFDEDMADESKEEVIAKPMSDDTDLVHSCSTEINEDETRAPIYLSGGAPPLDLIRERMTELEWYQLQQERFQDLSQHKPVVVEADSQPTMVASVLEATTPMTDLDDETLEDELNKRQLMASRGQTFHFSYQSSETEDAGASTASSLSASSNVAAAGGMEVKQMDGASTSTTVVDDKKVETPRFEQEFQPPFTVPDDVRLPITVKDHRIIAQTVKFLLTQGGQEEIKLKLKQRDNPSFYFLNYDHPLHPYYQWLKQHPICADMEVVEKKKINVTVAPVQTKSSSPFSTTPTPTVIAVSPATLAASDAVTMVTEVLSLIKAPPGVKPPPGIRKLPQIPIVLTTTTMPPSATATTSGTVAPQTTPTEIVGQLLLGYSDDDEEDENEEKSPGETIRLDPEIPTTDPSISTETKDSTPMIDSSSDVNNQEDSELMEQPTPLDQSPTQVSTTTLVSRPPSSSVSPATFVPVNKPPSLVGLLGYYDDDDDEEAMESSSHLPSTTIHSLAPASTATSTEIPPLGRMTPSTHPSDVTAAPCAPTHESTSPSAPPAATTSDLQSLPLPPSPFAPIPIPSALLALLPTPPQPIPSDQILTVIHKLCHFIHKNGPAFEALTRARERTNPTFQFLHEESPYFPYYQWVQSVQPILEVEESTNKAAAAVTPPKPTPADALFDPASIHPVTAPPSPSVSTTNTTMNVTATTPVTTTATSSMAEMLEAAKQQLREKLKLIHYKPEEE